MCIRDSPKGQDFTYLRRAVDWVESKGILKPPVEIKIQGSALTLRGKYHTTTNTIYLYEDPCMDAVLVHELVHRWQWDGTQWIVQEGIEEDANKLELEYIKEFY